MDKILVKNHSNPNIGMGVFSTGDIKNKTTVIESSPIREIPMRDKYSLEINGKHIIINKLGILVNHSCSPNCILIKNNHGAFDFVACRNIKKNEEITFDYESNETEITCFDECACGSEQCRKTMNSKP